MFSMGVLMLRLDHWFLSKLSKEIWVLLDSPWRPPKKAISFAETIAHEWCEILPRSLPVELTCSQQNDF